MNCSFRTLQACLLGMGFLLLNACDAPNENEDPEFKKGMDALAQKQIELAKNTFLDYLEKHPKSWLTHKYLGEIYFDELNRPEYAIYHFEQCIIIDPKNEECAQLQNWCKNARKIWFDQLRREFAPDDASAKERMEQEILKLKRELAEFRMKLRAANRPAVHAEPEVSTTAHVGPTPMTEAEKRRLAIERLRERAAGTPQPTQSPREIIVNNGATQHPTSQEVPPIQRKHIVVQGDNLSRISRKYYNSYNKVNTILNANPQLRNNPNAIRIGMELIIP